LKGGEKIYQIIGTFKDGPDYFYLNIGDYITISSLVIAVTADLRDTLIGNPIYTLKCGF